MKQIDTKTETQTETRGGACVVLEIGQDFEDLWIVHN